MVRTACRKENLEPKNLLPAMIYIINRHAMQKLQNKRLEQIKPPRASLGGGLAGFAASNRSQARRLPRTARQTWLAAKFASLTSPLTPARLANASSRPLLRKTSPVLLLSRTFCRLAPRFRLANSFVLILRGALV